MFIYFKTIITLKKNITRVKLEFTKYFLNEKNVLIGIVVK